MFRLCLLIGIFITSGVSAETLNIPSVPDDQSFQMRVLKEVVKRSDVYDSTNNAYGNTGDGSFEKTTNDLADGVIDILWTATHLELEEKMTAIYFPIFRGAFGMRVGIVPRSQQNKLAGVKSLSDLQQFSVCSGKTWADTFILEANGIKISKSLNYPNIFYMVEADRCDYFARGITEPWSEVASRPELDLVVDSNIMLRYQMPMLFFVKKGNTQLANHFTEILMQMFEDGSYDKLFFADESVNLALEMGKLQDRVIIDLKNPNNSPRIGQIPEQLWFDPIAGAQ
ncbi:type 2 periplasmic-binding domain-containing protein [Alginatibacterium sediminis]|nr:transporter substrate-binding domain-containing protein [Alginatibacterium sediminis]